VYKDYIIRKFLFYKIKNYGIKSLQKNLQVISFYSKMILAREGKFYEKIL